MKCGDCQVKESLSKREIVLWDDKSKTIQVSNLEKSSVYLLITNLIDATITDPQSQAGSCLECEQKIALLAYQITISSDSPQNELSFFKYCVLVLDSLTGAYKKTLGTNQKQLYLRGNLVAKHLTMQSEKKLKESQFQSITTASKQKMVNQSSIIYQQFPASHINESEMAKDMRAADMRASHEERFSLNQHHFTSQMHLPVNSQSQLAAFMMKKPLTEEQPKLKVQNKGEQFKNSKQGKDYSLFVIKMQKQIENLYRTQMLHEYVWQEEQTDFVMQQVTLHFGEFQSMQQKRRYIHFIFKRDNADVDFEEKWNTLSREILLRKNKIVEGKIINYYIFSKEQILPNKLLTNKLFLLPYTSPIIDMCLADPWISIAATNYVLFIHAYQPMDYFQHESKVLPLKLCVHPKNSSLLLILHREGISCFKLLDKIVALQSVCFTSFLQPHTIDFMGECLILAGVDYHQKQQKKTVSLKRMVYKIEDKFKNYQEDPNSSSTKAELQQQYEIMTVEQNKKLIPLLNLVVVPNKEVIACTFMNKFLLFSKHGHKLVQVELKSNISKCFYLPFIFNLFNFFVTTENSQAVRIGVESYGGALGTELQKMKLQKVQDCCLSLNQNAKNELIVASADLILKTNYLRDESLQIIKQQKGKIIFLSCDRMGVVYLIDLQHSFELKYLQI